MISAPAAKRYANQYMSDSGSTHVAGRASRDKTYGVWLVEQVDPGRPDDPLVGSELVVTDEGEVHVIPSDADEEEARGLAAWASSRRPWPGTLDEEFDKPYFQALMRFVDDERKHGPVYPPASDLFAAFHLTPYEKVKVVILGQDPYHRPGQANGLCFSVPRDTPYRRLPPSLKNIHHAMAHDGYDRPDHGDLTSWARQGVLLMNTALTVREGQANSHAEQWREFTRAVFSKLNDRADPIVFVLWGKEAQKMRGFIDEATHSVVDAPHPAARQQAQQDFRQSETFSRVNAELSQYQAAPIDWSLS